MAAHPAAAAGWRVRLWLGDDLLAAVCRVGPRELVFPADLAVELRAWPPDTSAPLTAELAPVAAAVVGCWQRGDLLGLDLSLEPGEDAGALTRRR